MRSLAIAAVILLTNAPFSAAQTTEKIVSTEWLQAHLHDRDVAVVEIGDRAGFEQSHIAGARFLALTDIAVTRDGIPNELPEFDRLSSVLGDAGVPDRGRIVVYARDVLAAARGFFTLDAIGCSSDVAMLDGGFAKWSAEKRPVTNGSTTAHGTTFASCARREARVRLDAMRMLVDAASANPSAVTIVDARLPEQFRQGHIPHAINVAWSDNLTPSAAPRFKRLADLRTLYGDIDPHATVVVYCRTGMQACLDYVVLRALGYDVYVYDGSFIEWSAAKGTAVEAG